MGIEIPAAVLSGQKSPPDLKFAEKTAPAPNAAPEKKAAEAEPQKSDLELVMKSLVQAAGIFNKRLSYSINDELGLVVVKVIDIETDKVIKELPAQEIQRLMARIREAIGLLVDETI
jgi:flagellar protein FlaG